MIEETLISYGGIGVLAVVMILQNNRLMKKADARELQLAQVVANNTIALTRVTETMRSCLKK